MPELRVNGDAIEFVESLKYLGFHLDRKMTVVWFRSRSQVAAKTIVHPKKLHRLSTHPHPLALSARLRALASSALKNFSHSVFRVFVFRVFTFRIRYLWTTFDHVRVRFSSVLFSSTEYLLPERVSPSSSMV